MQAPIVPVILCGGMGSRLWPMSRGKFPKQFLGLGENPHSSLLTETVRRLKKEPSIRPPVVVTNQEHRFLVAEHLRQAGAERSEIILEPAMRNTAPAITAAALRLHARYRDALMLVLPSDHLIKDNAAFLAGVKTAADAAREGYLVTFGITPEYAETGYGYIRQGTALNEGANDNPARRIGCFVEKPDAETAQHYLGSGEYSWNSGMFLFPVALFLEEMQAHNPELFAAVKRSVERGQQDQDFFRLEETNFLASPSISVDYAMMERTDKGAMVPLSCGWSDAGAWDALWRIGEKDEHGNVRRGSIYACDTENSYLHQFDGPPVATLGLEDLVVVSTRDVVLVAHKDRAQDVKKLMEQVGKENRQLVEQHQRVYRPWGHYETIEISDRHQVKHIHVNPGAKLSVQMHHHRSEHWIMVSGTARVLCDGEEMILSENQYVYIPLASIHSVENIGCIGLDFIEVQHGAYLGEDDIVRFSDLYGRTSAATAAAVPVTASGGV
jgi:mannose-1-phosphate guanylyltransferase/mannose-6-phosphate isomerase